MYKQEVFIRRVGNNFSHLNLNFTNRVFHSHATDFDKHETDSGLSVKLVIDGVEDYFIEGQKFHVTSGRFLVVNRHQEFICSIHDRKVAEGMCFYLDYDYVSQLYAAQFDSAEEMLDGKGNERKFKVLEKVYSVNETSLGHYLLQKLPILRDPDACQQLDYLELFQEMAERLVHDKIEVQKQIQRISNAKRSTREEIYRRVSRVRNYIDEHYLEDLNLEDLADLAHLSKFHFLRCFKEVYGISPYQYVLHRRLEHGRLLLGQSRSLSEIAHLTGFTDRRAFNKAFRKAYGLLPSHYRQMA